MNVQSCKAWRCRLFALALTAGLSVLGTQRVVATPSSAAPGTEVTTAAVPVEVRRAAQGWQLLRGGKPYFIKGAGARAGELHMVKQAGGNSVRTWDPKNLEPLLDEAHDLGLTVCVGIWIEHAKHGFDYDDKAATRQQLDDALRVVRRYKDHPAILMWAIGNEMASGTAHRNPNIFIQLNRIAKAIKKIDPHHPTMTVFAGTGGKRLAQFNRYCSDIDIIGPNLYGTSIAYIEDRLAETNVGKPYVIPEFGPPGQGAWGDRTTPWSAPYEPSSTEKAEPYLAHYMHPISSSPGRCLGGYAFYFKYDRFDRDWPTWYSMHHHTGEAYGGVDYMTFAWTGRWPENRAPEIHIFESAISGRFVNPRETYFIRAACADPNNDALMYEWVMARDHENGENFIRIPTDDFVIEQTDEGLHFHIPETKHGAFRLHLVVRDGRGKAARANVPFYVNPPTQTLMVLGDSNGASENGWVVALRGMLTSDTIINRSRSGNTVGFDNLGHERLNQLKQLDQDLLIAGAAAADSPAGRIDAVLINLGTNDCKDVFKGRGDKVVANLRRLVSRLQDHFSRTQHDAAPEILIVSPPPYGPDEKLKAKYHGGARRVASLVPRYAEVARQSGARFVDIHTPLAEDFDRLAPDGVHMAREGQRLIARLVAEELNRLGISDAEAPH
ncbi:MAG: GDSL-type esterase/lipase family protein [Planctomycetota bacterium]